MKQELIKEKIDSTIINATYLKHGQLGRIVGENKYKGLIITKAFCDLVCVYSEDKDFPAFSTTWTSPAGSSIKVELLKDESVVLSN